MPIDTWNDLIPSANRKEMLSDHDTKEKLVALRLNTQTGRPLANDSILSKLEHALGRRLRPSPSGVPEK